MAQESFDAVREDKGSSRQEDTSICARYVPRVRRYIGQRGIRRSDREDALQEVFLRFLLACARHEIDEHRVDAWLFAVARNVCADQIRAYARQAATLGGDEPEVAQPAGLERQETLQLLRTAIAALPESCRVPFEMRYDEHLSALEIATRLKLTPNAVYVRLCRARCLLFEALRDSL